jgi:hypothetical protein
MICISERLYAEKHSGRWPTLRLEILEPLPSCKFLMASTLKSPAFQLVEYRNLCDQKYGLMGEKLCGMEISLSRGESDFSAQVGAQLGS